MPEEHKKTLEEFEKLAASGYIDKEIVRMALSGVSKLKPKNSYSQTT